MFPVTINSSRAVFVRGTLSDGQQSLFSKRPRTKGSDADGFLFHRLPFLPPGQDAEDTADH